MANQEEWRAVQGWEGIYEVSNFGQVARLRRRGRCLLKHGLSKRGYHRVTLCRNNCKESWTVQTLVCRAFHGPKPVGCHAAHCNGNKDDNRASNLAWKTPTENEADKIRHGTKAVGPRNGKYTKPERTPRGEDHGRATLTEAEVLEIKRLYRPRAFPSRKLAAMFGISKTNVLDIVRGKIWTHLLENNSGKPE